jgi:hypothetical protein
MSYAQIKVHLTETEIEEAIIKAAKENFWSSANMDQELYVVDWSTSEAESFAIEANVALKPKEEDKKLPGLPEQFRG